MFIKGAVIVISNDYPCKDGNARFSMVPSKYFSDQCWHAVEIIRHFSKKPRWKTSVFKVINNGT